MIKTPRGLIFDSDSQVIALPLNSLVVNQTKFIIEMIELVLLAARNTEIKKMRFFEFL